MRLFAVIFLLLFTATPQQINPDIRPKETSVGKRDAKQETEDEPQTPAKVPPNVTIQECEDCFFAVDAPNANAKQHDAYDPRRDPLYRAYLGFTIFGVFAALLGIGAIYLQTRATTQAAEATAEGARATARSAQATEDSVRLQEIALKQWVNVGHWEAWIDKPTTQLRIRFHIINPTKLPIDLHMILIKIGTAPGGEQHLDTGIADVLAPDNPYIADVGIGLSEEQIDTLTNGEIVVLSLKCSVFFADSRTKHWEQSFDRFIVIGREIMNSGDPHVTPFVREVRNQLRPSDVKH